MTITSTKASGIHQATVHDTVRVARTVAAGFFDDPVTQWILPQVERRQQVATAMFQLYVEPYIAVGETYLTADASGASVWLPPGVELMTPEQEQAFGEALVERLGPDADRCFQLAEIFALHHPEEPIYYCQFISTVPGFQGQGIGTALLRDMLARADREGTPSYLEATSPRNRALYERHGYVATGVFTLPDDGPPLWPMWRQPGG
jgi:GNAT superfamily N-acetyltransferase